MLEAERIREHERAAHEKRNWIRLTARCNNRCAFCLDSNSLNGANVSPGTINARIVEGRREGATRLILSGGEPTIHPNFVEFVALGRSLGYRRIQTVTNGRMFSYRPFLEKCLDAGLQEITFSLHGPNAKIHDALVGVRGAFDQAMEGIRNALDDGRPIVNCDIVVNRMNVAHLTRMMDMLIEMGVKEFDLLQIIPFGRAFDEGHGRLFYDFEEHAGEIAAALEYAKRPDLHLWINRMPAPLLEGHETLIQDPYKLTDEVRGRREEFDALLSHNGALSCKDPERCRRCYLEALCGTLDATIESLRERRYPVFRVTGPAAAPYPMARTWVVARTAAEAAAIAAVQPGSEVILECDDYQGLAAEVVADGVDAAGADEVDRAQVVRVGGKRLVRAEAKTARAIEQLMALGGDFEVVVHLGPETAAYVLERFQPAPARMVFTVTNHPLVTENHERDIYLPAFFAACRFVEARTENIPACLSGRAPRRRPVVLDQRVLGDDGRIDVFGYTARYIEDHYYTKSRRCRDCLHDPACEGAHINFVRAHGFAPLHPVIQPT